MDWSEASLEIEKTQEWCIVVVSILSVGLLILAPCVSSPKPPSSTTTEPPPSPPPTNAPARSRRRPRAGGDSTTSSSSQFISAVENNEDTVVELELRTVPAPPRSVIATARRSQLMEQQQQRSSTIGVGGNPEVEKPLSTMLSQAAGSVLYEIETELNTIEQVELDQMNLARRQTQEQPLFAFHHESIRLHPDRRSTVVLDEYDVDDDPHQYLHENYQPHHDVDDETDDDVSVMPPLHPDQVAPEDAADAYDVGVTFPSTERLTQTWPSYVNYHHQNPYSTTKATTTSRPATAVNTITIVLEQWGELLMDIANPFFETRHMLNRAIPTTLSQHIVAPLQHVCLALVIGKLVNTESALAYSIVELVFRSTVDDLSLAMCDAQANQQLVLLQQQQLEQYQGRVIDQRPPGNALQLAISLQGILVTPMLILWWFGMKGTVQWLLGDVVLSAIAQQYVRILVWERLLRGMLRGYLVPFRWMIQYESSMWDLTLFSLALILIVFLLSQQSSTSLQNGDDSLTTVAYVQLGTTILTGMVKIYYVITQGWFQPYEQGMWEQIMLLDKNAVVAFLRQLSPLMVSTILELGEWDILLLIVRHLGRAEVATWIVFSLFWELFGSLTPGLGDAASARISEYLSTGFYHEAILLSRKVVLFGYLLAGSVGSLILLASSGIARTLTFDKTFLELMNDASGLLSLAVAAKIFSQLYWHLASAQGRFGLATLSSLTTKWLFILPLSLLLILAFRLDLRSTLLVVVVGHAGKTFFVGTKVFGTDWDALSRYIREQREVAFDAEEQYYDDDDNDNDDYHDDDDDDDDDDGSGGASDDMTPVDQDSHSEVDHTFTPKTQDITARDTETESDLPDIESEFDRFTPALV